MIRFDAQRDTLVDIPSTTPDHVWHAFIHKPQGRPAYAAATEGKREEGFFTCIFPQPRPVKSIEIGRATKRAKISGLTVALMRLRDAGYITPETHSDAVLVLMKAAG